MKLRVAAILLLSATLGCGEGGQTADALRERAEQGDRLSLGSDTSARWKLKEQLTHGAERSF